MCPFAIDARELNMKDKVVCDSRTQLHLSMPYDRGALIQPEFGQKITTRSAAAAGATSISIAFLQEDLAVGRELNFSGGTTAIVDSPAKRGDKSIIVAALAGAIAAFEDAETTGIQQSIVLANPLAVGDRSIVVAGLANFLPGYKTIDFGNNIKVRTTQEISLEGATELFLDRPADYALAAGASADIPFFSRLLSANSADDSSNAQVLNERNFESGKGTAKDVTSYNDTISFSGCFVKYDDAIDMLYEMKENSNYLGCAIKCILGINQDGARSVSGEVVLGTNSSQRPNDQAQKVQFTLEVDGNLSRVHYPTLTNGFK